MTLKEQLVTSVIGGLVNLLVRVDDADLARVPAHGPLILVPNHINFLDAPVLWVRLLPRRMTVLAKAETWDNPALGFLFSVGGAIPLRRGEADIGALRRALFLLERGHILGIAPEGHRSNTGILQRGHSGVVFVALKSGAPLQPVAFYGAEKFRSNIARLRRTDFHIVVGEPFYVDARGATVMGGLRQRIADEIMYQLAALLPPYYRGYYSNLSAATEEYLRFEPPARSNLLRAQQYCTRSAA
jgi:1-acyl-sn-glycerol-3-phosphate acyltransferase